MYYEVIPTKVFRAGADVLTYSSEIPLKAGQIVEIPLGRSKIPGIVKTELEKPEFATKPILRTIYDEPLPSHLLNALLWLSEYYLCPLPVVANLFLPTGVLKVRKRNFKDADAGRRSVVKIPLNPAQKQALEALESVPTATKLLNGVTGSGKTNIYLKLAENTLKAQKSVILLVPEIALTSQLVQVFESTFGQTVTKIHSRQTEAERHLTWETILKADEKDPKIIIGPRSALLAPLKNLGLILIDEAHEQTYFQENPPKYSALRLASFIANDLKISCVQGTATPLVADYYLAKENNAVIKLTERAKKTAEKPEIKVIDLKNREKFLKNRYFSDDLLKAIKENLKSGHQTLIFHNRRGSAPLTICEKCGWQALCPNCFLPLTLHADSYELICHTCGAHQKIPKSCPECKNPELVHKGFGTKLLEEELKKLEKTAKIARFDADNTKSNSLDALYDEVKSGDIDIIIGTQTIAKGLDLPKLKTVGVVQADAGLSLPDYGAEEKTFQLLSQVIGRVGRGHLKDTEVFIQTYQPDHPVILNAISENYDDFSDYLLKKRKKAAFPPFYYLAKLTLTYKTETTVLKHLKTYYSLLKSDKNLKISAMTPAFHERTPRGYTWQIVIKSKNRKSLVNALKKLPENSNLHLVLDPPSLI
ncbi:primosomal protein N' [Candidatus Saccharibacteria bacterium]|nr:primosomal protein N' [Candidatus Saccharibacteria bacterium]